jgi:diacylglycerol kinase family enzyme
MNDDLRGTMDWRSEHSDAESKLPPRRGTLFLNRSSGAKLGQTEHDALKSAAETAGLEVIPLARGVDCQKLIRERLDAGLKLFVACGGDGTINTVLQQLVGTDAVLGVIPVGTYNHFAKDVNIPLEWREALDVVVGGETKQVDVARANERHFVNNLSIGLYPELVARREEKGRDYPRWKARLYALFGTLRKYPHVTLEVESESRHGVIRTHIFMISNNSYDLSRAGIDAPRETLDGGVLSVYWLPPISRLALMKFAARYLAGRVEKTPGFSVFQTRSLRVDGRHATLRAGIDGELARLTTPLAITILPRSLSVRVPRSDSSHMVT